MKKVVRSRLVYLAPGSVGSTVGYRLRLKETETYDNGLTLDFTDCNRKVSMEVPLTKEGIKKLNRLIGVLSDAREELRRVVFKS